MADNPELLVRMTERPAGKTYACHQCAAVIRRKDVYRRIRVNAKRGELRAFRVITLCTRPECRPRLGLKWKG